MIAVLPLLLYPVLGVALTNFTLGFADRPSVVAVQGAEKLPAWMPTSAGFSPLPAATWVGFPAVAPDRLTAKTSAFKAARRHIRTAQRVCRMV